MEMNGYIKEGSNFLQLTLAHGNADVTSVRNVLFSHFRISQQFFKLLTEESLELSADSDLACKVKFQKNFILWLTASYE
jgi:hypothetical protein